MSSCYFLNVIQRLDMTAGIADAKGIGWLCPNSGANDQNLGRRCHAPRKIPYFASYSNASDVGTMEAVVIAPSGGRTEGSWDGTTGQIAADIRRRMYCPVICLQSS